MLKQTRSFNSDVSAASQSQSNVNTSRKSEEFLCHLPPKIPKLELRPATLYSKLFGKNGPEKPFVPPDLDAVPDISFVISPGTNANPRFRKPFISMENSLADLSVGEYKHLLDIANSGLVSLDPHPLTANAKASCPGTQSKSASMSDHSDVTTVSSMTVTATSPAADDWCSRVSNTPYLSKDWLSNLTTAVASSTSRRGKKRVQLEEEIRFWNNRRKASEEAKINELEMRLSCLLRTPPVLQDPYLHPQPIPQELPYKRPVKSALPVLTESQNAEVMLRLADAKEETVLVNSYRLAVTRRELITLTGTKWLNDMVINFYLQMLAHRSRQAVAAALMGALRVATMNSFFYPKLTSGPGYAGVRRWTRSINLFEHDLILVPIHDRTIHWCLVAIDLRKKTLSYYDSMGGVNDRCLDALLDYLNAESQDKLQKPLEAMSTWRKINMGTSVPQQSNGSDCGVFLCTYAEFLSRDAEFTFSQEDMPNIRKRMMYEILTRQLLTTGTRLGEG
ncbi:sentrin specific protease 1 [Echinococcus multilocularis]|uniref:Sentrin specific protease 1 n=1 Tax=Echinococcus multilocularis TaxID=6211 RepID=A0A068XVC2_ECHMU|nr:sentrin specific protease 1 [Echinococcus multilocularis]